MAKYFSRLFRLFSCCFGSGFCGSLLRGSDFAGRSFAVAFFAEEVVFSNEDALFNREEDLLEDSC